MKAMKLRALSLILMLVVALSGCTTTGDVDPADLDPGPRPTNTNQKVQAYLKNEIRNSDKFTDVDISEPKLGNRWVGLLTSGPGPKGNVPSWYVCVNWKEKQWPFGPTEKGPAVVWFKDNAVFYGSHAYNTDFGTFDCKRRRSS